MVKQIIGGYQVPLSEGVSLNKAAFDIEQPQIRKTDFTKSVVVPANADTNKLFENLFDVKTALLTFNPNLKKSYELIVDGISVLRGYCQLVDIKTTNGKTEYVLNARGAIGDLFSAIGDSKLDELDFSSLNHTWNRTNIEASWTPTLGTGYVYPMIDYGVKNSQDIWSVQEFKPAIFLKEYIDAIFESAGYTYTSTFFTSTRFKSLIIPQSSDVIALSEASIEARQYLVGRSTSNQTGIVNQQYDPSSATVLIFNDDSSPFYNTAAVNYSTSTGIFSCSIKGRYSFKAKLKMNFTYTPPSTQEQNFVQGVIDTLSDAYLTVYLIRKRSGSITILDTMAIELFDVLDGETISNPYTSATFTGVVSSSDFIVEVGDEISFRLGAVVLNGFQSAFLFGSSMSFTLQTTSQAGNTVRQTQILPGDTMVMNDTLPKEISQADLVSSIIKRFNLYLEYDADNDKNIIIEPLEDFLTGNVVDVSDWVDDFRERNVKPLGALKSGEFIFTDQEDEDILNTAYQNRKGETYGTKRYSVNNDFQLGEKKIETIFSPTPLWSATKENDRVISSIAFPKNDNGVSEEMAKIKLLYWGGKLNTAKTWFLDDGSTVYTQTQYPYAGHLDNPFNPTFDLNWGVVKLLFYDFSFGGQADILYTNANCFNVYWKTYIEQITDKDSKILEVYMVLDSHRYYLLSFRNTYFIDGMYWRLLEVQDFNPLGRQPAKCIFIALPDKEAFTSEQKTIFGGGGIFTDGEELPKKGVQAMIGQGSGVTTGVLAYGDNVATGRQSIQNSDNVTSGSGIRQTLTSGSDGAKLLAPRTAAINSPGVQIIRPDEMYINGVYLEKKLEVTLSIAEMKSLNSSPYQVIPAPDSDEYIRITRGYIRMAGTNFITTGIMYVRTITTNSNLAQTSATFFDTGSNAEILEMGTEVPNFGEGIELYQAKDMGGTGSSVTLTLIYQIIRF